VAIDPAVRALVAEELERSARVQRGRADAPRLLGQLDSLGRKLYPYQIEGVERFITHGRLLLADDMGPCKTTQAIAACHVLHRSKKVRRGLLIVPAALKPQWVREWQATTDIAITSVDGSPESRSRVYRQPKTPFLVMGYEQRLGQKSPIDVYNLVTEQGIEARIAALIATKKALFGGLFDGTTDSVRFEGQGSFLSDVGKLVAPLPDLPEAAAPPPNADDETDSDESPTVAESALDAALTDALPSEGSLSKRGAPSNPVRSGDPAQAAARAERPKELAELLRALQVTRAPDGTVTISAPPSTADALLSLLQGLTELVAASSASTGSLAAR
jgi:hypothetical protein